MILNKTVYLPIPIVCSALLVWSEAIRTESVPPIAAVAIYLVVTAAVFAPWKYEIVLMEKLVPVQSLSGSSMYRMCSIMTLAKEEGLDHPEGMTLDYFIDRSVKCWLPMGSVLTTRIHEP